MIKTFTKQLLSTALFFLLVFTVVPFEASAQQPAPAGVVAGNDVRPRALFNLVNGFNTALQ